MSSVSVYSTVGRFSYKFEQKSDVTQHYCKIWHQELDYTEAMLRSRLGHVMCAIVFAFHESNGHVQWIHPTTNTSNVWSNRHILVSMDTSKAWSNAHLGKNWMDLSNVPLQRNLDSSDIFKKKLRKSVRCIVKKIDQICRALFLTYFHSSCSGC